jgi:hypothetical protein
MKVSCFSAVLASWAGNHAVVRSPPVLWPFLLGMSHGVRRVGIELPPIVQASPAQAEKAWRESFSL